MKRRFAVVLILSLVAFAALAQTRRRTVKVPPNLVPSWGEPLLHLDATLTRAYIQGRAEFGGRRTVDDGLGPVFNDVACVFCHNQPSSGGGSVRTVRRIGAFNEGVFDPLANRGGSLLQALGIGPAHGSPHRFDAERVPAEASVVVLRRSQPLFGLGLVDATPDATFIALAAEQAARGDGTAGRVSMVDNPAAGMKTVGKFGWKAQVPTLFQFSGDALLNELGITNPQFPDENCPSGNCAELAFNPRPSLNDDGRLTQSLADFMILLAPPPRGPITPEVTEGERVFERIGCAACHVSTLQTGPHPSPALDRVTYHPYSDFLLHDMGTLGDGVEQDGAGAREMRTAPLWGLRAIPSNRLLHDTRGHSLEEAITLHDGQAATSRTRFNMLGEADRTKLLAFLQSL